jgi:hypothetical protein
MPCCRTGVRHRWYGRQVRLGCGDHRQTFLTPRMGTQALREVDPHGQAARRVAEIGEEFQRSLVHLDRRHRFLKAYGYWRDLSKDKADDGTHMFDRIDAVQTC